MRVKGYIDTVLIFGAVIVYSFVFLQSSIFIGNPYEKEEVLLLTGSPPFSTDPKHGGLSANILFFKSVEATLVTKYKKGHDFDGLIAESWTSNREKTEWRFKIRPKMFFQNGDPVDPDAIVLSFMRNIYILKQISSQGAFVNKLVGYEKIKSARSRIEGVRAEADEVVFKLNVPAPEIISQLALGQYAIVSHDDFDPDTGVWRDDKKVTASGPYELVEWTKDDVVIKLRETGFPNDFIHPRPIKSIKFVWNQEMRNRADILDGNSIDRIDVNEQQRIFIGSGTYKMALFRVNSWKLPNSPLSNADFRRKLRWQFYKNMEEHGYKAIKYLFLPGIGGAGNKEPSVEPVLRDDQKNYTLNITNRSDLVTLFNPCINVLEGILDRLSMLYGRVRLSLREIRAEYPDDLSSYKADLMALVADFPEDPTDEQIIYKFRNRESLYFTDTDGRINKELDKKPIDRMKVNLLVWDQAVIWPVLRFAGGLWVPKMIDASIYDVTYRPAEFQWLGWKQ